MHTLIRHYLCSKYLADPTEDVRTATENLLADFLRELRDIAIVQKRAEEKARHMRELEAYEQARKADDRLPDITMTHPERAAFLPEGEANTADSSADADVKDIGSTALLQIKPSSEDADICLSSCSRSRCKSRSRGYSRNPSAATRQ